MFTYQNLKDSVRSLVFPTGEAVNLVTQHDKLILDGYVQVQTWVKCFQQDNRTKVPHCATLYNCGLTSFDFNRAMIKGLSVIDKINPETHLEDATADDDYCSEIKYEEVDYCFIEAYYARSRRSGCCLPISQFFAIPAPLCRKGTFAVPTDEGVPEGLPLLPFGFHYPQESTNATCGRALKGYWAKQRSKIFVVPWIQSTETILVTWDGINRSIQLGDLVEDDPEFIATIAAYVRRETKRLYNDIPGDLVEFKESYALALQGMIHACREETRIRGCETSVARGSSVVSLFYNDQQQYTASCPGGTTGSAKTATVPSGTVGSTISKADANQKARQEAQAQAEALLVCTAIPVTYYNTAQTATVSCTQEEGAPIPDGVPSTVTIPAGTYSSTVSQAAADALALAAAEEQAAEQANCTYWNREVTYTADCDEATEVVIPAHTYSSTVSQADADNQAEQAAKAEGDAQCPDVFESTEQTYQAHFNCPSCGLITLNVTIPAAYATSTVSQADANAQALNNALPHVTLRFQQLCNSNNCGEHDFDLGGI